MIYLVSKKGIELVDGENLIGAGAYKFPWNKRSRIFVCQFPRLCMVKVHTYPILSILLRISCSLDMIDEFLMIFLNVRTRNMLLIWIEEKTTSAPHEACIIRQQFKSLIESLVTFTHERVGLNERFGARKLRFGQEKRNKIASLPISFRPKLIQLVINHSHRLFTFKSFDPHLSESCKIWFSPLHGVSNSGACQMKDDQEWRNFTSILLHNIKASLVWIFE